MWNHADSAKIKTVRVPARLDGYVGVRPFMRVASAGPVEQPELPIGQVECSAPKISGEICGTLSVVRVSAFVEPPRIVKNGEERNDFRVATSNPCQTQSVFEHSCPVRHTMKAVQWQFVLAENRSENSGDVERRFVWPPLTWWSLDGCHSVSIAVPRSAAKLLPPPERA